MRLEVLAEATNKLLRVERPSAEELREMLVIACKELRILVSDPEFLPSLQPTSATPETIDAEVKQLFDDLSRFAGFLEVERKVLLEAGLNEEATKALLKQAEAMRPLLRNRQPIHADELRLALIKLANEACNLAELSKATEAQQFRQVARPILRRAAQVVGGSATIAANIAAAVKLGSVYSTTSISLGTELIKRGLFSG